MIDETNKGCAAVLSRMSLKMRKKMKNRSKINPFGKILIFQFQLVFQDPFLIIINFSEIESIEIDYRILKNWYHYLKLHSTFINDKSPFAKCVKK